MNWMIVTCWNTQHIVRIQKYLFEKYAENETLCYVNIGDTPISEWTYRVFERLNMYYLPDYVVFGLDDYLPTSELIPERLDKALDICKRDDLQRFEIGYGASMKGDRRYTKHSDYWQYKTDTPYTVSTQFSIWNSISLRIALKKVRNPWEFEMEAKLERVGCFPDPCIHCIEQGAISKRIPGKINLYGMSAVDIDDLVARGMVKRKDIVYGTK